MSDTVCCREMGDPWGVRTFRLLARGHARPWAVAGERAGSPKVARGARPLRLGQPSWGPRITCWTPAGCRTVSQFLAGTAPKALFSAFDPDCCLVWSDRRANLVRSAPHWAESPSRQICRWPGRRLVADQTQQGSAVTSTLGVDAGAADVPDKGGCRMSLSHPLATGVFRAASPDRAGACCQHRQPG